MVTDGSHKNYTVLFILEMPAINSNFDRFIYKIVVVI